MSRYGNDVSVRGKKVKVSNMLDIVPLLDHIYLPMDEWFAFLRKCKERNVDCHEYLAIALKQEIDHAIEYDDLL